VVSLFGCGLEGVASARAAFLSAQAQREGEIKRERKREGKRVAV